MASAFFYGTLMHPKVLQRVIEHQGPDLKICPAVLLKAEYPGLIPYEQSSQLVHRELAYEERSVRGVVVTGLSEKDLLLLDQFEGEDYDRKGVDVHPLAALVSLSEYPLDNGALIPSKPPALPPASELTTAIRVETYVYILFDRLEPEPWSFEEFARKNAWKWYQEQLPEDDVRWAEPEEEMP
ncbi:hypothetical protein H0H92_011392 [Tricholoma furcatifolium]|nr:hypothetical protein H0H92_011392 [Tricholoma furcatifolium]